MLENRLLTRFNWGLTANITPPDFDLRMNIIEKNVANIADMVFEYNNDIGDKSYANSYNTIAELNITYTPEAVN